MSTRKLLTYFLAVAIPLAWRWWTKRGNSGSSRTITDPKADRRKSASCQTDQPVIDPPMIVDWNENELVINPPRSASPQSCLCWDMGHTEADCPQTVGFRFRAMVHAFELLTDACSYMTDCYESHNYSVNWPRIVFCAQFVAECSLKSLMAWKTQTVCIGHNLVTLLRHAGIDRNEDSYERLYQLCLELEALTGDHRELAISTRYHKGLSLLDAIDDDASQPSLVFEEAEAIAASKASQEIYNISYRLFRIEALNFNQQVNFQNFVPSLSSASCQWRFEPCSISWAKPANSSRKPKATNKYYACETNFTFD